MAVLVYSDPHLGRSMQAHTTVASRQRLTNAIYQTCLDTLRQGPNGPKVCLGDLFDKFQNSEAIIEQGVAIAEYSKFIMAGNHDITNDPNKMGSLQLLHSLGQDTHGCEILLSSFGKPECYLKRVDRYDFVFVPHHTTDELFQQSLDDAREWVVSRKAPQDRLTEVFTHRPPAYLCVHCNYDSGFAVDESALTLTRKQAKDLLDSGFDYILIGHDHHPREDWDGRVIILGNTHPTGFGDITPKRVLEIGDDGKHRFHTIWTPTGRYVELDAEMLIGGDPEFVPEGVQFIDIKGKVRPEHVMHMAKAIRGLWTTYEPLAIRNKAEIIKVEGGDAVSYDFQSIDKVVLEDLQKAPELSELFLTYWNRTAAGLEED